MTESDYEKTIKVLIAAKITSPRLEARLLLAAATKKKSDEINSSTILTPAQQKCLQSMLDKRLNHTPIDKILGYKEFYKYTFKVNENVLSPRPDTEILLEAALRLIAGYKLKNVCDLGTGSGCILLSILKEFPNIQGFGFDKSAAALEIARENACKLGVQKQCRLQQGDWFSADFFSLKLPKFDIIVSNPPYIPQADILKLDKEVRCYDPILALDGGYDGLDSYRKIAEIAPSLLTDNGFILLEAGISQAQIVQKIFEKQGLKPFDILKDLSGIERCVILQKKQQAKDVSFSMRK